MYEPGDRRCGKCMDRLGRFLHEQIAAASLDTIACIVGFFLHGDWRFELQIK